MTPNNINPNSANSDTKQEEHITFSVHDLIQTVIANWYWFVIPVFVCVGCGYIYILRTPKIYSRTANILVKDSRKGGDTDLATLSDLAGLSQRRNVDNEIYILQSRRLMTEVVKQLGLTVQYETKEGLRPQDLYGQSPIAVEFINDNDPAGIPVRSFAAPRQHRKTQLLRNIRSRQTEIQAGNFGRIRRYDLHAWSAK